MAWYHITYACGHDDRVQIYGTNAHGERERKAEWYGTILCPECERKARDEENRKHADWCAEHGCVNLEGSEKQVLWANSIRFQVLRGLEKAYAGLPADDATVREKGAGIIRRLKEETRASWWIDNRFSGNFRTAIAIGKE